MFGVEAMRRSLASLWGHKARSLLTILGVVIGVASVLTVTSLGAAFEISIVSQFDDLDERSIFVAATTEGVQQGPPDAGQFGLIFTEVDRAALADLEGVESVLASGQVSVTRLSTGDVKLPFRQVTATTPDAGDVRDPADYASGGPFEMGAFQVVLGNRVAHRLGDVEVDDEVTMDFGNGETRTLLVTGILAPQTNPFFGNDELVFVPIDPFYTVRATSPTTNDQVRVYTGFTVLAEDPRDVEEVKQRVQDHMTGSSDARELLQEGLVIQVATPRDIQSGISAVFDQITLFIAAIAGVSLLVGGIMIGTIMLISVAERTREIGMMKAIGALDRDILWMFLLEAAIIGFIGSVVGILLGLLGGIALVEFLFGGGETDVSFVMPWDWVAYSVLVGIGTGLVAGLLPAGRATRIQPVEALGYE